MLGFCGWFNYKTSTENAHSFLASMSEKIQQQKNTNPFEKYTDVSNALCAQPDEIHHDEHIVVACTGHPSLNEKSHDYLENSNTDVQHLLSSSIALLYKKFGIKFLDFITGDFALAIIDKKKNKTILAIDKIGIQHLAYAQKGNTLVFSTDIQAVRQHPVIPAEISNQGIFNYFYFHMIPSPGSIYEGIEKLLPGQYVEFQNGNLHQDFYWSIDYTESLNNNKDEQQKQFFELLNHSVKSRISDKHVGAFLSGGLDSSTMAGILASQQEKAQTFSIGFNAEGYDETPYARVTAKHFNTDHHELYITPEDVYNAIPLIASAYDEPFGNASAIPAYYCARFAKENGIELLIAGDGGDEIFAGNERYVKQQVFEYYDLLPQFLKHKLIEPIVDHSPWMNNIPLLSKASSYIGQAKIPLPSRLETYNFLNRTPLETMFENDFLKSIDPNIPVLSMEETYHHTNSNHTLNKMLNLDMKLTIADNDIRKVNRMCELADIDVVYPLLDENMVNFAAAIPHDLKIKNRQLRYFFKQATKGFLPDETINKQKHGFGLPFGIWLNEYKPLHELAHESLLSLENRGYFKKGYIEHLWKQHNSGHSTYYGVMIWVMMMFEQWLKSHA